MIPRSSVGLRQRVGIAIALILVAASCGDGRGSDAEQESSWGSLAVGPAVPNGGDEALIGGVLTLDGNCTAVETGTESVLLVWPADRTTPVQEEGSISFETLDGELHTLSYGNDVTFAGGGSSVDEGGLPAAAWIERIDWVAEPEQSCVENSRWSITDFVP